MKISELSDIFRNFSEEDFKAFLNYLRSLNLKGSKTIFEIFKMIQKNKKLLLYQDNEKIVDKLIENLKVSGNTIMQSFSYINKAVLGYLKIKSFLGDVPNSEFYLNKYLLKTGNFKLLERNLKKTGNLIYGSERLNEEFFLNSFNYNTLFIDFTAGNIRFADKKTSKQVVPYILDASEDITLYFIIQQIHLFANYLLVMVDSGNSEITGFAFEIMNLINEIERKKLFIKLNRRREIFKLYKLMFLMFYRRNIINNYIKFRRCFEELTNILSIDWINFHYKGLIGFCIMKERLGEKKEFYKKQQAELMLEYIDKNYFIVDENKYLHPSVYRNYIMIVYSLADFKLLKNFIKNHTSKLNPGDYNDMENYGLMYFYYGIKNYRMALDSIEKIRTKDFIYKFDIRNTEIKIYYETGEDITLLDVIHNYRKTINDDMLISRSYKKSILKFLEYLNKLILIRNKTDLNLRYEAGFLLNRLNKEQSIAFRPWLQRMLNELVKKPAKIHG